MNNIEDRLRTELGELADALIAQQQATHDPARNQWDAEPALPMAGEDQPVRRLRRPRLVGLAAGMLVVAGFGYLAIGNDGSAETVIAQGTPAIPTSFGTWDTIADAPIDPRPYGVTAWTGSEFVVWAGSSLSRGFAYTDGAIYQPETDSWALMDVPGWGHPGLSSAFFDGELYALAKGGGTRFDPIAGQWSDLPPVEGMFLAATVATDRGVWGLGPADVNGSGQPDLAIAEFDPDNDSWRYGPVFEGTDEQAEIVAGLGMFETTTLWTGTEIVVWRSTNGGIAFDPVTESWRTMPHPQSPSGLIHSSIAVQLDEGMAVLAQVENSDGVAVDVAVLNADGAWQWLETDIPVSGLESITVAGAGDWIAMFFAGEDPVMVHLPTGAWKQQTEGPLRGIQAPNIAWTGTQLIVWGGVTANAGAPDGATWTPPD